ncbi:double-stranded RNA-binding protein 1-like isoform X2 [Cicer arietinum]|uniref:Uncharacterized protein LOC101501330 isoform X2 n=1 Tax=Cicer arietinum TaxID=3827 RepID=A0A3Q7YCT5_CICAR|nr:uncharacterized protein LOC101501330 isoform X2 [Cicer arietinum]
MYKVKLQELCHKKSWSLPEYETTREGPPHNPRFTSTVTVNSIPFTTVSPSRSVKLSQNDAAMIAFNHFSQLNPISSSSSSPFLPNLSSFPQPHLSTSSFSPGSPVARPQVHDMLPTNRDLQNLLPTNRDLQPKSEVACPTSQISSTVTDGVKAQDTKSIIHLYKNQLQNYAQKRNLNLPEYSSEWEGPPHAMRFRCKVTIDGQTFECPKFYSTLKDAEHAAAEFAFMSLSPSGVQEDDIVVYKNLLQELVQKEGFHLPVYSTNKSGEAHKPTFTSQVEVEGEVFTGQEAKSKKQAEMSAAKVAYTILKERKGESEPSSSVPLSARQGQASYFPSDHSESNVITDLQHDADPKSLVRLGLVTCNQPNKDKQNMFSQSSKELLGMKHQEQELDSTSQSTSQNNPTKGPQLTLSPTSCVASLADAPTNSSSSSWNTCGQKRLSIPTTGKGKGKKKK